MFRDRRSLLLLLLFTMSLVTHAQVQPGTPAAGVAAPGELVGRWVLIATIRSGEDVTTSGITQVGDPLMYDFKADGTFSITRGAKIAETGTWTANDKVVPKTFDHRRFVDARLGRLIPGIYESGGDVLKMCLFPPSESNTRPPKCEARPENRSSIYIMKREAK